MGGREQRAAELRLIGGGALAPDAAGRVVFCGHCGELTPRSRHGVCYECRHGVLLETDARAAPHEEGFLVVEPSLRIVAVSERAENVLGVYEADATGRPVTRYLIAAHSQRRSQPNYATAIYDALAAGIMQRAWARLARQPSMLVRLRIAACSSPSAALVVFESPAG